MKKQLKFEWQKDIIAGEIQRHFLHVNNIKVGKAFALIPKYCGKFRFVCNLPDTPKHSVEYDSLAAAQEGLEKMVEKWFTKTTGEDYENYD